MRTKKILLACFVLLTGSIGAVSEGTCKYLETCGGDKKNFTIKIEVVGDTTVILTDRGSEKYTIFCDSTGANFRWTTSIPDEKTEITASRRGSFVDISGIFKGDSIHKTLEAGAYLWIQPMALSVSTFIRSGEEKLDFWMIRPDKLSGMRMTVEKADKPVEIDVCGAKISAVEVKKTVHGLSSLIWKSHYWFHESDDLFLKYEGVNGIPGTPKTTVELTE